MHLVVRSYDAIELQRLKSEIEGRGIKVNVSDEFTYAIPGMPGAEQPRALWVADFDDLLPAQRVVVDLIGEDRLPTDDDEENQPVAPGEPTAIQASDKLFSLLPWLFAGLVILALLMLSR